MSDISNDNTIQMTKAMLFAAGLGTRLKPFTENHPKALAEVNGRTLLNRNIHFLYQAGIREIIVNTHHFADQVHAAIGMINLPELLISISHEAEEPLETGGGLVFAKDFFLSDSNPFVVMNVDILSDISLEKMFHYHNERKPLATLAVTQRESSRKFLFDQHMKLAGWQNTKTGLKRLCTEETANLQAFAFSGIHIISPEIFQFLPENGKFSITDAYLKIAEEQVIMGYDHSGDFVIDVGKPESLIQAASFFN